MLSAYAVRTPTTPTNKHPRTESWSSFDAIFIYCVPTFPFRGLAQKGQGCLVPLHCKFLSNLDGLKNPTILGVLAEFQPPSRLFTASTLISRKPTLAITSSRPARRRSPAPARGCAPAEWS